MELQSFPLSPCLAASLRISSGQKYLIDSYRLKAQGWIIYNPSGQLQKRDIQFHFSPVIQFETSEKTLINFKLKGFNGLYLFLINVQEFLMVLGWWFSFSSIESATKIQKTFLDKSDGHSNRQIQNSSNQRLPVSDFLPTNIHPCSSLYLYWLRLTLDVIRRKGVWSHTGQESRREWTSHTLKFITAFAQ